jgi:GNAT superfamily N-acetyltransferase
MVLHVTVEQPRGAVRRGFEQSDEAGPLGEVEVRRAAAADLVALVAVLGQHFFTDRLARQRDGRGVLLVAWADGRPVGDVFLDHGPADQPEVRRHLPGVPMLDHLEVLERLQRRGIGTALVRAGEDTARRLGHRRLALGVGVDTPGARRLYERLGYADWGHGTIVGTWVERDRAGPPVTVSERLHLLVKPLSAHGPT